jgi:prevent-host-death family protein
MAETYSMYDAKAKFSEVIRKVRAGRRIVIAYRGERVAEIAPPERWGSDMAQILRRAEEEGVLTRASERPGKFKTIAKRPGALARFLKSRE